MIRFLPLIVFFIASNAYAVAYVDTVNHPHEMQIDVLHNKGIVEGYGGGVFDPDKEINRAEFLKIVMLSVYGDQAFVVGNRNCFADFYGVEQWFWVYACKAKEFGIVEGYPDGTFRGTQTVNLVEVLKMMSEAWRVPLPELQPGQDWYQPYLELGIARGLFEYFPLRPAHLMSRAEMAYSIVQMDEPIASVTPGVIPDPEPPSLPPGVCGDGVLNPGEMCDDGNTEDGDGCSSICVIVPEPVRHGVLEIQQEPTGMTMETGGAENVELLGFRAGAGRQDVRITGLKFKAGVGDLNDVENFKLVVDTNYDNVPDTIIETQSPQSGILTFTAPIDLVEGYWRRASVFAEFREEGAPTTIGLEFATDESRFVDAVGMIDGRDLSGITVDEDECDESICWITVYTRGVQTITIAERGNLYVTEDTSPVSSRQLLGGAESDVLFRIEFLAENETIEVTDISITGGNSSIDHLRLYKEGSSTPFASAYSSGCPSVNSTDFCAQASLIIPKDQDEVILVTAMMKDDNEGAVSGDTATLALSAATTGNVAVEARGQASQEDLSQNDGDSTAEGEIFIGRTTAGANTSFAGPTHSIVVAKEVSIVNGLSDPDGTAVPVGVSPIGGFTFNAASHGNTSGGSNDFTVEDLVFTVSAPNVELAAGSFRLYNKADSSTTTSCTEGGTTGSFSVTCSGLDSSSVSTSASQGSSMTLILQADVTNPQVGVGGSTLQVSLNNLGNPANPGTIVWNDGVTTFDWIEIETTVVRSTTFRNS